MARTTILIELDDAAFEVAKSDAARHDVSPETWVGFVLEQQVNRDQRRARRSDDADTSVDGGGSMLPGHSAYCWCSACTPPVWQPPKDHEEAARWVQRLTLTASQMLARAEDLLAATETPEGTPQPPKTDGPRAPQA